MQSFFPQLSFPRYEFKIKEGNKTQIFDEVRKKFVVLEPEEWVRQNLIKLFHIEFSFPYSRMLVEKKIDVNTQVKRADLVLYDKAANPLLLAECKSFTKNINQPSINQIANYNLYYKCKYVLLTNGLKFFVYEINFNDNSISQLKSLSDIKI